MLCIKKKVHVQTLKLSVRGFKITMNLEAKIRETNQGASPYPPCRGQGTAECGWIGLNREDSHGWIQSPPAGELDTISYLWIMVGDSAFVFHVFGDSDICQVRSPTSGLCWGRGQHNTCSRFYAALSGLCLCPTSSLSFLCWYRRDVP